MSNQVAADPRAAMRLMSWNVAGRVRRLGEVVDAIEKLQPDVVALQEITPGNVTTIGAGLRERGLPFVIDSITDAPTSREPAGARKYGELIASRWPLTQLPPAGFHVPWPERVLSAVIATPGGEVELHTAHLPTGVDHGWIKIETFEGIFLRLAHPSPTPRILCGDFNSPQCESNGQIVTWGQDVDSHGCATTGPWSGRWDRGERSVLEGLATYDLGDAFRRLYPDTEEFSWVWRGRGKGGTAKRVERRFDHIFASQSLNVVECCYVHELRERRLSDHAAVLAEFHPRRAD